MKTSLASYIALAAMLALFLPDSFGFAEQWRTFYWDPDYWHDIMQTHDGSSQLVADFFTQFLATRWSAALMLALPLTVLCLMLKAILKPLFKKLAGKKPLFGRCWMSGLTALLLTMLCSWLWLCSGQNQLKSLMCKTSKGDWQGIISQCEGQKLTSQLELNMLNLALAETSQLPQKLMQQPCRDINSLMVLQIESPYVAALISDIYWSMGEISVSQMYAFEANEKLDNLSPRLLKRLALTNIVFGHYEVAEKYLSWLDKTLFYRSWAALCRTLLSDEAVMADPVLSLKRRCIPTENCFPSAQSVYYDLQLIVANNPGHTTSAQYLEAIKKIYHLQ